MDAVISVFAILIILSPPIILCVFIHRYVTAFLDGKKRCAWCKINRTKLVLYDSKVGGWYWNFRNKDGSPDGRFKTKNFQIARFHSTYTCKKCNAQTSFIHAPEQEPNLKSRIIRRSLEREGEGERVGTDWLDDD